MRELTLQNNVINTFCEMKTVELEAANSAQNHWAAQQQAYARDYPAYFICFDERGNTRAFYFEMWRATNGFFVGT